MDDIKAVWDQLGPVPSDPKLEQKLDHVKLDNDCSASDESVWIARSKKNAELYIESEREIFAELDKQVRAA